MYHKTILIVRIKIEGGKRRRPAAIEAFLLNFLDIFNIVNRYDCFLYRAHSGKALRDDHDAGTLAAAFRCRLA
jgi:hypothetical protein